MNPTIHETSALRRPVSGHDPHHLPPMGVSWLLHLYDPLTRLLGVARLHGRLVEAAELRPGHRVLEIGCGTGNLTLMAKKRQPEAVVVGLDPDFAALAQARRKARRRHLDVQWDSGSAAELPYPDGSVDRVLSSLMLHHVPTGEKVQALREVRRVLAADGELHLADFGGHPEHGLHSRLARRSPMLTDQVGEGLTSLLHEAGFAELTEDTVRSRYLGSVSVYRARG